MDPPVRPTPDDEAADPYSYLFPIGYSNSSECGYCHGSGKGRWKKRFSYYAIATHLKPEFYQKLVDRCWRRSGTLLYRPNPRHSCCPHYTLRLDSTKIKLTKDQRQAINRFNRHILGCDYVANVNRLYPRTRAEKRRRHNVFDLVERIHESEAQYVKPSPIPDHEFTVTLEPDTFTEEKYEVFENYQRVVHREPPDKISRRGFRRFLCNSPIVRGTYRDYDGSQRPLGSYHMCYRIDGKLVAVGVLDLLPECVSAVYFLYHESIHWLNPGKLGALREIAFAREYGYRWWYPGYYIHSCPKMKYKIDYRPQNVLDPETLQWYPLTKETLELFDKGPYVSFSRWTAEPGDDTPPKPKKPKQPEFDSDVSTNSNESQAEEEKEEAFLLTSSMPGIPTLEEMRRINMDHIVLRSDYSDRFIVASNLVVWSREDIGQHHSLKASIAELVAAIGPDLIPELCVDFRKRERSSGSD